MSKPVNGHDHTKDGSVDIAIGIHQGKVVIHWHQPTTQISFDPQNAFQFGEQIARTAHKARFGTEAPNDGSYLGQQIKAKLTEDLRDRLAIRAGHIMRTLLEKGKAPEWIGKEIVDAVFSEVDR